MTDLNESKMLKDLWDIKEEAYREVSNFSTLKDKITERLNICQKATARFKELSLNNVPFQKK